MYRWYAFIGIICILGAVLIWFSVPNRPARKSRRKREHQEEAFPVGLITGLLAGTLLGFLLGIYTSNFTLGIILGPGVGIALGIAMALLERTDKESTERRRRRKFELWLYPAILIVLLALIWVIKTYLDLPY